MDIDVVHQRILYAKFVLFGAAVVVPFFVVVLFFVAVAIKFLLCVQGTYPSNDV
jgi:hypothetical protein